MKATYKEEEVSITVESFDLIQQKQSTKFSFMVKCIKIFDKFS